MHKPRAAVLNPAVAQCKPVPGWLVAAVSQVTCLAGDATVKGYTKLINKSGAYTEIANNGTDEKRCKE